MALAATTVWEVQTGGSDTANSGAFDPGQTAGMATDGAATSATGNSPVFSSASYNFAAGDVNAYVYIGAGTNWTPGWYKIVSVAANQATLAATVGIAVTQSTLAPNTVAGCATVASPTGATWSIDYSQQTSPRFTYIDLASVGTGLTVSSVLSPFAIQHVGNSLVITGGTNFNTGRYVIASVAAAVATVVGPTNITTGAGVTGTGSMGGAMATPGGPSPPHVGGNKIYIKSGTYTQTSASSNTAGGGLTLKASTTALSTAIVGYGSVRGDQGTKPLLQAGSITSFTMIVNNNGTRVDNLALDGVSATSSRGSSGTSSSEMYRCKFSNFTNGAVVIGNLILCEATGCSTSAAFSSSGGTMTATSCVADVNSSTGFSANGTTLAVFIDCYSINNTGSSNGFDAGNANMTCINCVSYGNAGKGFLGTTQGSQYTDLINCIAVNNTGGAGYDGSSVGSVKIRSCAAYNNTGGATANFANGNIINLITLTGDPFTNAAGGDFSLNNTAGAGAVCRSAGIPSSSGIFALPGISTAAYPDLGAAQTQSTVTNTTSGSRIFTGF